MFNPIELHLKPSWLSTLLFIAPAMLAAVLVDATTLAREWVYGLWVLLATTSLWYVVDVALLRCSGSVTRARLGVTQPCVFIRDGEQIPVQAGSRTLPLPGVVILHLEACDIPSRPWHRRHWLLVLHRHALHDAHALRRLRVAIRFNKMNPSLNPPEIQT